MARSASDTMPDIFTNGPRASQSRRLVRRSRARLHSGFPALGERLVRRSPLPILLLDAVIVVFAAVSGPLEPFALQNRIDLLTRTSRWPSPLRRGCSPGRPAAGASSTLRAMGEIIEFPSNGGADQGYLAVPASGSGPGVVVIQEWWGLVDHIKDVCDRFAEAGFVALAPDLYHGRSTTEPDEAAKAMMALRMEQAARDMSGAVDEVQRRSSGNAVGVIGFCMGGGLALVLATQRPDAVKAVVPCYGLIPWPDAAPGLQRPLGEGAGALRGERRVLLTGERPSARRASSAVSARRSTSSSIRPPSMRSSTTRDPRCTTPRSPASCGTAPSSSFGTR